MAASNADGGREYLKYIGLGFEFAVAVGAGFLAGNWADGRWQCEPWGLFIGGALGFAVGLYRLAKDGLKAMRELDRFDNNRNDRRKTRRSD